METSNLSTSEISELNNETGPILVQKAMIDLKDVFEENLSEKFKEPKAVHLKFIFLCFYCYLNHIS